LRAGCPSRYRRPLDRQDQNRTSPQHIIVRTLSSENKERILKVSRKKGQVTYKGKPIRRLLNRNLKSKEGME
jgi:hypothetical protein